MQTMLHISKSLLILFILALINPSWLPAATEQRIALVIGNGAYSSGPLKNPINDATDMAAMLKKLGFTVTLKKDAKLREMDEAIEAFGNSLKRGGVGLFYYAGHGVQVNGINYLLPIGARINKEADVKYEAVDANKILDEMASANNGLNIVMLDACRDNPFARSFRNAARGLAIVSSAPSGTFVSYSTSPGNVARDGEGRNSPYTQAVLENIAKPGLSINNVFMNVRSKVKRETGQIPWELSSLEIDFYFVIQGSRVNIITNDPSYSTKSDLKTEADELARQKAALEREKQEMAREKQEMERQKALDAEREQLAAERRKLEAERQQLAMAKRPSQPTTGETARDGRFIAYSNGTVLDTSTGLMWAAKDNGSNINWANAKSYCENYRGGGYTNWRMPTQGELAGLYNAAKTYKSECGNNAHLAELIRLTCTTAWASETRGSDVAVFGFHNGVRAWHPQSLDIDYRTLPVRSGQPTTGEIARDGRFIAYNNGTVLDTNTNLMWAAKDNGSNIYWPDAKSYCENYRGGGYTDWRMPTQDELAGLYDRSKSYKSDCGHYVGLTELIHLTCNAPWSTTTRGDQAVYFGFDGGNKRWSGQFGGGLRALPVRSGK